LRRLGRIVGDGVIEGASADRVVVVMRDKEQIAELVTAGVEMRAGDFDAPVSLPGAFAEVERLLLIGTSVVGARVPGHVAPVEAVAEPGVAHVAFQQRAAAGCGEAAINLEVNIDPVPPEHPSEAARPAWPPRSFGAPRRRTQGCRPTGCRSTCRNAGSGATGYVTRTDCAAVPVAVMEPFAGCKLPGNGRENGRYGVKGSLQTKAVQV
jgi:NAD(P)H dehydrogenase (quinone)